MNDLPLVVDTSVLIHFMEGHPIAAERLIGREAHDSVATEIELLAMGRTKRNTLDVITRTLALCYVWDISPLIKEHCIWLRSEYRMKLADALVAATATSLNMQLLTADRDFMRLKDVVDLNFI
ncbi:MAG: PIN domain-containing protein [Flavobacteriales bacterium]|nr:PIN domain-containing protein [Flavobacteriales bacterium]